MKISWIISGILAAVIVIAGLMQRLATGNERQGGDSQSQQNRKIFVEYTNAHYETAKLDTKAEVERTKGTSESMKIENGKLTSTYNQYLFIRTLKKISDKGSLPQAIYIPTKGMLPVMKVDSAGPN